MNRLDDAVHDLLTVAPPAPDLDALRRRSQKRRNRRRAVAGGVVVVAVGVAVLTPSLIGREHGPASVRVVGPSVAPSTTPTTIPASSLGRLHKAVDAWASFPVQASPRPLVLTSDPVSAPPSGFPSDDTKEAFLSGLFTAPARVPTGPAEASGYPVISAADALTTMRNEGTPAGGAPRQPAPLIVTDVHFGTAPFATDRGTVVLPAWMFSFEGVQDPAAVLAVAPSARFSLPAGFESMVGAHLAPDGRTLTVNFVGAAAGTGPCTADYTVDQLASQTAVAVAVRQTRDGGAPGTLCYDIGYSRTVTIKLASPLGGRVLVDAQTKAPIRLAS